MVKGKDPVSLIRNIGTCFAFSCVRFNVELLLNFFSWAFDILPVTFSPSFLEGQEDLCKTRQKTQYLVTKNHISKICF